MKRDVHLSRLFLALCLSLAPCMAMAGETSVPAPGASQTVDAIKERGMLRAGILAGFPWLVQNVSGAGEAYEGPAWILLKTLADRLGARIELIPVSHETKVPVVQTGQVDLSIAPLSVTEPRKKVVDFVVYSHSSICMFGKADNPRLTKTVSLDDMNRPDITVAYFTGAAEEPWVKSRFPKAAARGVTGSGTAAPVEEIISGRADVAPIDKTSWVTLNKQVPGLRSWPEGDACLRSTEFSNEVGMAVSKNDSVFRDWVRAVETDIHPKLEEDELRLMRAGENP